MKFPEPIRVILHWYNWTDRTLNKGVINLSSRQRKGFFIFANLYERTAGGPELLRANYVNLQALSGLPANEPS